jgi:hypothetical protein
MKFLLLVVISLSALQLKTSFRLNLWSTNLLQGFSTKRPFCRSRVHPRILNSHRQLHVGGPNLNQSIFCNVELNATNLQAVGFDMDFTLAQVSNTSLLF